MTINTVYKNVAVQDIVTIQAGQTESNIYNCIGSGGFGAHALRRVTFSSSFTPGDFNFMIYKDLLDPSPLPLSISDGTNRTVYTITVGGLMTVSLLPYAFDSVLYFSIKGSSPQVSTATIEIILQPIYQGVA